MKVQPVPEICDWKQKYRDSLVEMESEERRWRQLEQVLRRLIGRLCAAGMGVDRQLDDELGALAAANRRNADAAHLEQMADSLTAVVAAIDAASPVLRRAPLRPAGPKPPHAAEPANREPVPLARAAAAPHAAAPVSFAAVPAPRLPAAIPQAAAGPPSPPRSLSIARWDSTCAAVAGLLERLKADEHVDARADSLIDELATADTDAALTSIVARAADLIHERSESIARERLQAASVLSEVTQRLEEMSNYLTEAHSASRGHFSDTQSFNDTVMSQVRELTDEVSGATELSHLQSLVNARMESVAKQLDDFRDREENRLLEYTGRAEHMQSRIADLERETQELHSKLDREKHGARLDPLTGAPNRKSFEEHFSQAISRHTHKGAPTAMLLWDIDDFKIINDTYGHRAGDRVLQSVAACFKASIRATDFVARIGGEEFAILLGGLTLAEAVRIANQVRAAVEGLRFHFREIPVRVTASCGIAELKEGDTAEAVFDRADAALYQAKHTGKNLCVAA